MSEFVSFKNLIAVVTVAGEMDLGRAAKKLNTSSFALKKQIRGLENLLELRIFYRNGNHHELTESGRTFVAECESLLMLCPRGPSCVREHRR
jgi:DNA-binding transcriptional LysR family regulator